MIDRGDPEKLGFGILARPTRPLAKELRVRGVAVASYPGLVTGTVVIGMRNGPSVSKQSAEGGRVIERPDLAPRSAL